MSFFRLLWRDCVYYCKTFVALSVTICLVCAILTSAMLIGDSVRGTLYDNLNRNTAFVKMRVRFFLPIDADVPGAVLHTRGFIAPGIKTHLYALTDSQITGRDAWCSTALAEALNLRDGDLLTVRVQTISPIPGESIMGRPPQLKQVQFIYRGVWPGRHVDVNFENPQLRENNLFVNHAFLAESLGLEANAVNEVWLPTYEEVFASFLLKRLLTKLDRIQLLPDEETPIPELSDEVIWQLSQLEFDRWDDRPILKSKAFFLPQELPNLFPEAVQGLTVFVESFSDGENTLQYCFVGAFDGDILPVEENHAIISDALDEDFPLGGTLTYFSTDTFRQIEHKTLAISQATKASDSHVTSVLTPEIPGLTDMSDCTEWDTGLPLDLNQIQSADVNYWEEHKSKPKLYLNFTQAQQLFCPGRSTVLIFDRDADTTQIRQKIIAALREDSRLYQADDVVESLRANIAGGNHFTPLFLGLSFFIVIASLLVLAMLLKLHLFDRAEEFRVIASHTSCERKTAWFHLVEIVVVLLPGMLTGLLFGTFLCLGQLYLLERVWNGIILMNRLNFHAQPTTFLVAFAATWCCAILVLAYSLRSRQTAARYFGKHSRPIRSAFALGTCSFFRRLGQYRVCMILLTMGFLGTLGIGAFGIKNRGEDAFSYLYVAETALPVVPSHDEPFPPGGFTVRVKYADSADCSNILRAGTPTVYGCDTSLLTPCPSPLAHHSATVDAGSLQWIMKKRIGDVIAYPNGSVTLQHTMKASVFQRGILVNDETFGELFPEVQGAQFFLIRDHESAEIWRKYLEPYGVTLDTADAFMARAESFQNRYLMIFLQLGTLGFILGIGSLLLLMIRNLHAQRDEIRFMSDLGFSRNTLFGAYCVENLWLYLSSALFSLAVLCLIAIVAQLHLSTLFIGWSLLTTLGVTLIFITLRIFFNQVR